MFSHQKSIDYQKSSEQETDTEGNDAPFLFEIKLLVECTISDLHLAFTKVVKVHIQEYARDEWESKCDHEEEDCQSQFDVLATAVCVWFEDVDQWGEE